MIIDFRMRPPARGFLNIGVYDDVARTAKLTECFSMKQATTTSSACWVIFRAVSWVWPGSTPPKRKNRWKKSTVPC